MTTIQELERRCAVGESIVEIAEAIGATKQCVSARLIRARAARESELPDLTSGDMLREKDTGHRWQYVGPSERLGCVRIATEGGAHCMDMSIARLEKAQKDPYGEGPQEDEKGRYGTCEVLFSVGRGDDPNDPRFKRIIARALEVRKRLDQEKQEATKTDPDANLRATARRKVEARKQLDE